MTSIFSCAEDRYATQARSSTDAPTFSWATLESVYSGEDERQASVKFFQALRKARKELLANEERRDLYVRLVRGRFGSGSTHRFPREAFRLCEETENGRRLSSLSVLLLSGPLSWPCLGAKACLIAPV